MQLVKDLLTDSLYIQTENSYSQFSPNHWEYYREGGYLPTILQYLKDGGMEVLPVWNKWTFQNNWELKIVWRDESDSYSECPMLCLQGEPGLEPSEEQKNETILKFNKQEEEDRLQNAKWEQERKDRELKLSQALESIVGAKVVEFIPPCNDEENYNKGYIVVENQQGQLIKFSSCHWMESYEDAADSISITLL